MNDRAPPPAPAAPAWQTCLDVENQSGDHYLDYWNEALLKLVDRPPNRVLELGCAAGAFGEQLKRRHPQARVVGIEANRAAAERAAARLDHVVCARLEEVDFEGAPPDGGAFDLAVAADVLEHLVNPWRLLTRLRACLAPGATLLASIPNVRNLALVSRLLLEGRWPYAERGLLDISHLRFFALDDMRAMLEETGYAVEGFAINVSRDLTALWHEHRDKPAATLRVGRMVLENVAPRELAELCAEQFLIRCRVA